MKIAGDATHPDGGTATFDHVEVLGPVAHDDLLSMMRRAGLYVLPAMYEPFGLSAVEAALCGCPLVLGDIPSLREVWGDAALFVSPDEPAALREVIGRLIADEAARQSLAERGRERARTFTSGRQAAGYVEVYDAVTNGCEIAPPSS